MAVSAQEMYAKLSTSRKWLERALVVLAERDAFVGVAHARMAALAEKVCAGQELAYSELMEARAELRRTGYVEKLVRIAQEKEASKAAPPAVKPLSRRELQRRNARVRAEWESGAAWWDDNRSLGEMWEFCSSFPQYSPERSIAAWTQSFVRRGRLPPPDLRAKLIKVALASGWHSGATHWSEARTD